MKLGLRFAWLIVKLEALLQRLIRRSAAGHGFLLTCGALSLVGTFTALYPVTAVVLPAALIQPRRWRGVTLACAVGSALGATALVGAFHVLGWSLAAKYFPELAAHSAWQEAAAWIDSYGLLALLVIAATPLPQTPALVLFGLGEPDYPWVFAAMLAGKLFKYGGLAWLASHFPQRFARGLRGVLRRKDEA